MRRVREAAFVIAVGEGQAERRFRVAAEKRVTAAHPAVTSGIRIGTAITAVMQCIKDHESGDYTEHSHPDTGSGAYQYIPGTWRTWAARAGFMGYELAYQAPPWVQDAVTAFTLTNGGAGNWSNRFGFDPCTGGL